MYHINCFSLIARGHVGTSRRASRAFQHAGASYQSDQGLFPECLPLIICFSKSYEVGQVSRMQPASVADHHDHRKTSQSSSPCQLISYLAHDRAGFSDCIFQALIRRSASLVASYASCDLSCSLTKSDLYHAYARHCRSVRRRGTYATTTTTKSASKSRLMPIHLQVR